MYVFLFKRLTTFLVVTHSGAHSLVKVIRHQLGNAGKDLCYSIQMILDIQLYICGNVLQTWNFNDQ